MDYKICKLHFKTGFRIGEGNKESNSIEIPCDILFSSVINEASRTDLKICENLIQNFKMKNLKISDAFPFIKEEYLLPKPLINFKNASGDSSKKKLYKKIKHIPISKFFEFVEGKSDPEEILEKTKNLGENQIDSKIKKDGELAEIYNVSYFRFEESSGLYFILGYEKTFESEFFEIFESLGITGIGGKKTSGLGKFELEIKELPEEFKNKIDSKNSKMLLSTSMAKKEELYKIDDGANYALLRRGGFIYSENKNLKDFQIKRKRTMYFFKSGSIFNQKFEGDLFRVYENFSHPVYRYAIPMWLEVI